MNREEVSSHIVSTESKVLTAVIEAEEGREVACCNIPNACIQTTLDEKDEEGNRMIMKIRGVLVDILCEVNPTYEQFVVKDSSNNKILYMDITKAIYMVY
jgi:hypothetical protein